MPDLNTPDNQTYFAALYRELRALAERELKRNQGTPLSPTTLIHEAYLGMAAGAARFEDRARFMGYAARVMRSLIIDCARERRALKRGAGFHITQIPADGDIPLPDDRQLVELADAVDELGSHSPHLAELVDLRYFCGYTLEEIAAVQGQSLRTVQRDWEKARLILFQQLR